jgi:hypothetical protein
MDAPDCRRFLDGRVTLYLGDCLDVLDRLPENSVDAVITDPPYHFDTIVQRFGKDGAAPAKFGTDGVFSRASAGFMGKDWDGGDIAFRPETWAKVLRVLKPGGHLAAFSAPKCVHKMAFGIEAAGFEVRDRILHLFDLDEHVVAFLESLTPAQADALFRLLDHFGPLGEAFWTFGSGFPKNHDVSKAIDKMRHGEVDSVRAICRFIRKHMDRKRVKSKDLTKHFGDCNPRLVDHWAARDSDSQPSLPTAEQWATLKRVLDLPDDMDEAFTTLDARKGQFGDGWHERDIVGGVEEWADRSNYALTSRDGFKRGDAVLEQAIQWQGWGTALKPAYEPIMIARKPLAESSIARQVLKTGTGAINIDAARVETGDQITATRNVALDSAAGGVYGGADQPGEYVQREGGRFPANLTHDGSAAVLAGFPEQSSGGTPAARHADKFGATYGDFKGEPETGIGGSSGSAARFFYTAKADAHDRIGSGHPTVKPLDLMQWLCRMLTPPRGVILDLFGGTGTTGEAAYREGFDAILIEREPEYQADIARRMENATAGPLRRRHAGLRAKNARRGTAPNPDSNIADLFGA